MRFGGRRVPRAASPSATTNKKGRRGNEPQPLPLFGQSVLGKPKATAAAEMVSGAEIDFVPLGVGVGVETLSETTSRIVLAVDVNIARAAIQNRYPARILSAATRDLRADLLRVAAVEGDACLRCFNPPEPRPEDKELRERIAAARQAEIERSPSPGPWPARTVSAATAVTQVARCASQDRRSTFGASVRGHLVRGGVKKVTRRAREQTCATVTMSRSHVERVAAVTRRAAA